MSASPLVEVTRVDIHTRQHVRESIHRGHLVVTGPDDAIVLALGDPHHVTLVRSTAKPFQATACIELLGTDGAALTGQEVAIAWSSHRAEARHLAAVRSLLARSGRSEEQLTCPVASGEADPGAPPARIRRDCSGKHALFALAGRRLGISGQALTDPDGPLQRVILAGLADALGEAQAVAIDGCGAPAIAVPLVGLARGYGALAAGGRWARVRDAGLAHPGLVGGQGRPETALLEARIVAKSGAEGVFAAGFLDRAGRPFGLAVKVADGASRAAGTAVVGLLERCGVAPALTWRSPAPTGGDQVVGEVRPTAGLLAAADRIEL